MLLQFLKPRLRGTTAAIRQQRLVSARHRIPLRFQPALTSQTRSYTSPPPSNQHTHFPVAARLSGQTCMITGGTSGIGYAIAERFLQEGAERVILVGRSYERLAGAAKRLETLDLPGGHRNDIRSGDEIAIRAPEEDRSPGVIEAGRKVSLLVGDVSESGSWARLLEGEMAKVDILINAAGVTNTNLLPRIAPADISLTLRTNLEGAITTSRAMMRSLIRTRRTNSARTPPTEGNDGQRTTKCIINISSLLAHKGGTGAVPYAASKAGLLGLTRSLSVEAAGLLKEKGVMVRSNAIVPGYIETPMTADFSQNETTRLKEDIPLGRFGTPQEIADAAVFLAQNEYANNCILNLDGGLSGV